MLFISVLVQVTTWRGWRREEGRVVQNMLEAFKSDNRPVDWAMMWWERKRRFRLLEQKKINRDGEWVSEINWKINSQWLELSVISFVCCITHGTRSPDFSIRWLHQPTLPQPWRPLAVMRSLSQAAGIKCFRTHCGSQTELHVLKAWYYSILQEERVCTCCGNGNKCTFMLVCVHFTARHHVNYIIWYKTSPPQTLLLQLQKYRILCTRLSTYCDHPLWTKLWTKPMLLKRTLSRRK